jgi:hypothetical protein
MIFEYDSCVCERCEETIQVPIWNLITKTWVDGSCQPIVSLRNMEVKSDFASKSSKTTFDLVCVDCLTDSESDQIDAYFAKGE